MLMIYSGYDVQSSDSPEMKLNGSLGCPYFDQWFLKKMILLVSEGIMSSTIQTHASLNARNPIVDVGETNNIVSSLMNANILPLTPRRVVGIIDIVNNGEVLRRSNDCMSPPPKKKWIQHYLLGKSFFSCASKNARYQYYIISKTCLKIKDNIAKIIIT